MLQRVPAVNDIVPVNCVSASVGARWREMDSLPALHLIPSHQLTRVPEIKCFICQKGNIIVPRYTFLHNNNKTS